MKIRQFQRRGSHVKESRKSTPFIEKLNQRLHSTVSEDINMLMDLAGSLSSFRSRSELEEYLSEGSLLQVTPLSSHALAIPTGEYMVWVTNAAHTKLIPVNETKKPQDVFAAQPRQYDVITQDLLESWSTMTRVLSEQSPEDERQEWQDDGRDSEEADYDRDTDWSSEEDDEDDDSGDGEFGSRIHMATVDRSPIVRAMEQNGHTVTSLAKAVGVDPPAISRILRTPKDDRRGDPGGRNPSIQLAADIARELKSDSESLFPDIFDDM